MMDQSVTDQFRPPKDFRDFFIGHHERCRKGAKKEKGVRERGGE